MAKFYGVRRRLTAYKVSAGDEDFRVAQNQIEDSSGLSRPLHRGHDCRDGLASGIRKHPLTRPELARRPNSMVRSAKGLRFGRCQIPEFGADSPEVVLRDED